jgi:protein TonB
MKTRFWKGNILTFCFALFFIANGFGQKSDTTIYKVLDIYPEFRYATEKSTVKSLERYFEENFKMPRILIDNGYAGRIIVQFVVEINGLVNQVEIFQGMGDGLDKAILEFVENMPNWSAGEKDGKIVRSQIIIPISVKWLYGRVNEYYEEKKLSNKNIYLIALEKHLDYLKEFNKSRPDLIKIPEIYYVEQDIYSTENFPNEINGQKIALLSRKEIIGKVRGKKTLTLLSVRPVRWNNARMEIHVIEFTVSGNKRHLNFTNMANGSSFIVKNNINCEGFEIERITR